jgi:hypothetical protein
VDNKNKFNVIFFMLIIVITIFVFKTYYADKSEINRAIIVDGLVGYSNQTFITQATEILSSSGFECDVIEPNDVTVDFYQSLPSKGYDLIILRVHCGPLRRELSEGNYLPEGTAFFTTELYEADKYKGLQEKGLLAVARIQGDNLNRFFAIPPLFFEEMEENFVNTTIILDSCYGFWSDAPLIMAETLRQKGVIMFIGWNGEVQVEHTDAAIQNLIKKLYHEKLSVDESVNAVLNKIGPDPYYGSKLLYYPVESGNLVYKKNERN